MRPVLVTPSIVGGYRILDVIGHGGMGTVYRALQPSLDREVAVKVLAPSLAHDAHFRDRFTRESRAAAAIDHPHVLPVIEAGEDAGVLYIAMQYVPDGDLARLLMTVGRLEPTVAGALLTQIADALDAAHARGLVHRDVKPGNLLIADRNGEYHAYLTDFGVSSRHGSHSGLTGADGWVGTVNYVAPEQIRGDPVSGSADVYSLGCVFYETMTGTVPFPRPSEIATLWAHVRDDPPRASALAGVPRSIDHVIAGALAKQPERRYGSAGDFASDAAAALARDGGRTVAGAAKRTRARRPGPMRAPLRQPVWLASLALAAGALAAVLAISSPGKRNPPAHRTTAVKPVGTMIGRPIPVGSRPAAIAFGHGGAWVANHGDDTVSFIDPHTNTVVGRPIKVGRAPQSLAISGGYVWVANEIGDSVTRIDARTRRVVGAPIRVAAEPYAVAAGGRYVWVASEASGTVTTIDAHRARVTGRPIHLRRGIGGGFAADNRTVWVGSYTSGTVQRIAVRSRRPLAGPLVVGGHPNSIALYGKYAWVGLSDPYALVRLDRRSGLIVGSPVGLRDSPPNGIYAEAGSVWIATLGTDALNRVDTRRVQLVGRTVRPGQLPVAVSTGASSVWVANQGDDTVARIQPTPRRAIR